MPQDDTARAIRETLGSPNDSERDDANVVDGLLALAGAIRYAARHLGKEEASDPMGAIEFLAKEVHDGAEAIAGALHEVAAAIREGRDG